MKVTVGGRERIQLISLSIPKGEDAWIEFVAGTWHMRFHVISKSGEGDDESTSATVKCIDAGGHAELSLLHWTPGERMVFLDPLLIGSDEGRDIVAFVKGEVLNTTTLLELDFFWEKIDE